MIQSVSAFSPRAGFRGSNKSYGRMPQKASSEIALLNAAGTSIAAGGLTTAVARSYTSSWSHAGVLGICGSALALFFIAPKLVESLGIGNSKKLEAEGLKKDSIKTAISKEAVKPTAKRLILFKQQN